MSSSWPQRGALLSALLGLLGCDSAQELQWDVRFSDPALGPDVVAFEATIELGGCASTEELYAIQFPAAGPGGAPEPPDLDPGTYGFRVSGRDASCRVIVAGCETINLPDADGVVEVLLESQPPAPACGLAACDAGICTETDGGVGPECAPGRGDCNLNPEDECEVDLTTSLDHCGGCDLPCRTPHATPRCMSGACEIAACDDDFFDCDGDPSNGCETSILTRTDCGRCRMPGEDALCALDHATEACGSGVCEIVACHDGWGDCDGVVSNGCETPLGTGANCGACGDACDAATPSCDVSGATPTCVATCPAGSTTCGTSCVDTASDPRHCGACDAACIADNADATCGGGRCALAACDPGWDNCDGAESTGCETSTTTATDCGACGSACAVDDAATECATGTCRISECYGPRDDCNADASDGCEADLFSATTCGDCATSCAAPTATCGPGGSGCVSECPAPTMACGDRCLDTRFDDDNCGGCGIRCDPANLEYCAFGVCEMLVCSLGFADCDGVLRNGCETFVDGDVDNCGACDNVCPTAPGAEVTCASGACRLDCESGLDDCNGDPSDGCEADLGSVSNCGSCGNSCSFPNASTSCSGGACTMGACDPGFGDCNAVASDGCESDTQTDSDHCGSCGTRCRGQDDTCCAGRCAESCG